MDQYEKEGYLRESFRLFHLTDTSLKEMSLHYHDFDKIILFRGGNVTYMIEGKSYFLEPGDLVFVSRNHIHKPTIDFSVPYERTVIYMNHDFLEQFRTKEYEPDFCFKEAIREKKYVLRVPDFLETKAGKTLTELENCMKAQEYGAKQQEELLFLSFMIYVNRICREGGNRQKEAAAVYNQKVISLLTYMNEHLFENLTVEQLAETFYISKYHMMRQFKAETGYTIHKYLTEKRIMAAKEKLLAGVSVTRAGAECGFQDYSTFLRAFMNSTGITPTEFIADRLKGGQRNLL